MSKNLKNKKAILENAIKTYNKTIFIEDVKQQDVTAAIEAVDKALNDYKSVRKSEAYAALVKSEHPMIEAAKQYSFDTLKIKTDAETGELSLVGAEVVFNPEELEKKCGASPAGVDKNWIHKTERLNKHFVLKEYEESTNIKCNLSELDDSFYMHEIVKTKDLGKNPTSNATITKLIQEVVNMMIGEGYKVTSHDFRFIAKKFVVKIKVSKSDKKIVYVCAKHKDLYATMFALCAKLVNGWTYDISYETVKK